MKNKKIEWNNKLHLQLADVYMSVEDNISCYDGCKEMAIDHFENNFKDAMQIIERNKYETK
jgi:hypothetical protein